MELTVKQENFCNLYVETGNASEAYRRAYSADRMLDSTINRKAIEQLENVKVTAHIKQLQAELQRRSDISKDEAVRELTNIVRVRITDILTIKGDKVELKDLDSLPDHIVCAIQSVKKTGDTIEVKLYDKIAAIDRLSRMMGWQHLREISFGSYEAVMVEIHFLLLQKNCGRLHVNISNGVILTPGR